VRVTDQHEGNKTFDISKGQSIGGGCSLSSEEVTDEEASPTQRRKEFLDSRILAGYFRKEAEECSVETRGQLSLRDVDESLATM